ncbi:MAG: sugar phosphate isomerase/epimerase [Lachnospiraceae bacterium]|nr:sugar phosphate isomerase/epimerase [Lachnospiraceae bacterium]
MERIPIAVQVYSVREEAAADFDGTMKELAAMGYEGVELAGLYGKSPKEIRASLDRWGLKPVSAHVPYEEFVRDLGGTMEAYREIGCRYVAIPWLSPERWYGGEKYRETVSYIGVIAEKCREAGMKLLYHNHTFEFAQTQDGARQLDAFYGEKETAELSAELDLCWVKVGGADPVEYLRKYSGRCPVVHVKDFVKEDKPVLVALGDGELGVGPVVSQAAASGAEWLVVEQDDHFYGSPMENMRKSIACLKKLEQ